MLFQVNVVFLVICSSVQSNFIVATYNLWNIMFNWDVRKYRISQMIRENGADIVAFQEVRSHMSGKNQMHDIQKLVPWFKYQVYEKVHTVVQKEYTYNVQWGDEGIGLISQYPIVSSHVQSLVYHKGPDTNVRKVLHVSVKHPEMGELLVSVVHFSYDRKQQCDNMVQTMEYLADVDADYKIILGDFNAYNDFEMPSKLLTDAKNRQAWKACTSPRKTSIETVMKKLEKISGQFYDAWIRVGTHAGGFTFSNMPVPGLESRPDRVYVSKNLDVVTATLEGHGDVYTSKFYTHILLSRISNTMAAASDAYKGEMGRSCSYDCGPHASCRCGVCVRGGDENACDIPECPECGTTTYTYFLLFSFIAVLLVIQLLYSCVRVMKTMNNRSHRPCVNLPCCNYFCLCDASMFNTIPSASSSKHSRRNQSLLVKFLPHLKLPPMVLLIVTLVLCAWYAEMFVNVFRGALDDIGGIIPEELYPSDHLMLTVQLKTLH